MTKRYWMISVLTLVLLAALLLPACAEPAPAPTPAPAPAPPPAPAPKTIKISYTCPPGKSYSAGLEYLAEEFPKRTNGRYDCETYPANTLVTLPAALDATKGRLAEIVVFSTTIFSKDFPLLIATSLPVGVDLTTKEEWIAAHDMSWEFYNTFPEVQAECKDFKLLWPNMLHPIYLVTMDKEVHFPEDFKGMKIGAGGPTADIVKAYGGASVHQVPPQAYMNMDKGVVEAGFFSWAMASDWKIHELANYYYTMNFGNGTLLIAMNLEAWNELSAEDQKILEETMADAARGPMVEGMLKEEAYGRQIATENAKVYAPTPEEAAAWQKACAPAIEEWANIAQSMGIEYPEPFYEAFKKMQKKYFPEQK